MQLKSKMKVKQSAFPGVPVVDPAAWSARDLEVDKDWVYPLLDSEIAELDAAVKKIEVNDVSLLDIRPELYEMPSLSLRLMNIRQDIIEGRGLALIRGVPVADYSRLQSAIAFGL